MSNKNIQYLELILLKHEFVFKANLRKKFSLNHKCHPETSSELAE